jgi:hypothetical protein
VQGDDLGAHARVPKSGARVEENPSVRPSASSRRPCPTRSTMTSDTATRAPWQSRSTFRSTSGRSNPLEEMPIALTTKTPQPAEDLLVKEVVAADAHQLSGALGSDRELLGPRTTRISVAALREAGCTVVLIAVVADRRCGRHPALTRERGQCHLSARRGWRSPAPAVGDRVQFVDSKTHFAQRCEAVLELAGLTREVTDRSWLAALELGLDQAPGIARDRCALRESHPAEGGRCLVRDRDAGDVVLGLHTK